MPTPEETGRSPRVYVFHAQHPAKHVEQVIEFATMLRMDAGIDVNLPAWRPMQRSDEVVDELTRFREADFVLVVASPAMRSLMDSTKQGPAGDTTHIGAALARDTLAENLREELRRMLPVVLPGASVEDLPRMLRSYATDVFPIPEFDVDRDEVRKLLHMLWEVPEHSKPPMGSKYLVDPAPREPLRPIAEAPADVLLQPGAVIALGRRECLVHGDVEIPTGEGVPAVLRQAPALLIGSPNERVWLRQVERKADARDTEEAFAALDTERELLDELGLPHDTVPRVLDLVDEVRTRTLVLAWPRRNTPPEEFTTLADHVPPPSGQPDSTVVRRTLEALAGLARPLEELHRRQRTHRELTPRAIVRIDEDHFALRDLGAAARPPRAGEDASSYRAPEQTRRGQGKIGPGTDVFRLAAVAYHVISGRPPGDGSPLPTRAVCRVVPDQAGAAIDAALHPVPAQRPSLSDLAASFRI